jgi:5-methylcytosine-specific restriction protein A
MFAMDYVPRRHPLQKGEILLLQLVLSDAPKPSERIRFALVFERIVEDSNNESERIWGQHWEYLVYGSNVISTIPFSLPEVPAIGRSYAGQTQCLLLNPEDEALIMPYLNLQDAEPGFAIRSFGKHALLKQISGHDRIVLASAKPSPVAGIRDQYQRDPSLAVALKELYEYRCQICETDFKPKYNQPFSETHHIKALAESGRDVSKNLLVLCPNHHRIVHATHAEFDHARLLYKYPNRYEERVRLTDHLTFVNGEPTFR